MVVIVVPMRMVGRDTERAELLRAWSRVATGRRARPRTVVITGGAGVGKSLLASSVVAALTPRPRVVLAGTARLHAPAPYDWLAAVLSGRDTTALPVPADALAWLAQHPDAPGERYAPGALLRLAVATVRALVGAERSGPPALLLVEDLHAFDPASLSLVAELATVPDLPVLLIVTSRPPETGVAPQLAARTLARLSSAPGSIRQHLGPLAPAQVARLLADVYPGRSLPSATVQAVWERTRGNPYWLSELLAAAGPSAPDALDRVPLPEYLRLVAPVDSGPGWSEPVPGRRRGRSARGGLDRGMPEHRGIEHSGPDHGGSDRGGLDRAGLDRGVPEHGGLDHGGPERGGLRRGGAAPARGGALVAEAEPVDLTAREREVLSCLAEGMSNKQVAQSLGISIRTVTVHVSNLLRKTRSASRTEAAVWALQRR